MDLDDVEDSSNVEPFYPPVFTNQNIQTFSTFIPSANQQENDSKHQQIKQKVEIIANDLESEVGSKLIEICLQIQNREFEEKEEKFVKISKEIIENVLKSLPNFVEPQNFLICVVASKKINLHFSFVAGKNLRILIDDFLQIFLFQKIQNFAENFFPIEKVEESLKNFQDFTPKEIVQELDKNFGPSWSISISNPFESQKIAVEIYPQIKTMNYRII